MTMKITWQVSGEVRIPAQVSGCRTQRALKHFFFNLIYLFLVALGFLCSRLFSSCEQWGLLSSCRARSSRCGCLFCHGAQSLEHTG